MCNVCSKSLPESALEVDHVIPLSDGGTDEDDNLQTLCIPCHREKTNQEAENRRPE